MTLKLSELEKQCQLLEGRRARSMTVMSELTPFDEQVRILISWAKRARPWIQRAYSQKDKEREVIEDLYGVDEPYLSGLAEEIAELEQLLGEVGE